MRLSLRALEYLVATADAGNLTEASKRLNVTQPSISVAIAQIETELNAQIFIRHRAKGVTLTAHGRQIVTEARALLQYAREFTENALNRNSDIRGEISIGCFINLANRFMPELLAGFAQLHPGVNIRIEEGNQKSVFAGLLEGRTDIAISYEYAMPDEIIGFPLARLLPHVILPADHALAHRSEIELPELEDTPFILLDLPFTRDYFMNLFRLSGMQPRIAYRSQSYELIRGLVGHGLGYTLHNSVSSMGMTYDQRTVATVPLVGSYIEPCGVVCSQLRSAVARPTVAAFQDYLKLNFKALCSSGNVPQLTTGPEGLRQLSH